MNLDFDNIQKTLEKNLSLYVEAQTAQEEY